MTLAKDILRDIILAMDRSDLPLSYQLSGDNSGHKLHVRLAGGEEWILSAALGRKPVSHQKSANGKVLREQKMYDSALAPSDLRLLAAIAALVTAAGWTVGEGGEENALERALTDIRVALGFEEKTRAG